MQSMTANDVPVAIKDENVEVPHRTDRAWG